MEVEEFWYPDEGNIGLSPDQLTAWENTYHVTLPKVFKILYQTQNGGFVDAGFWDDEGDHIIIEALPPIDNSSDVSLRPLGQMPLFQETLAEIKASNETSELQNFLEELGDPDKIVPFAGDGNYFLCLDWNDDEEETAAEPDVVYIDLDQDFFCVSLEVSFAEMIDRLNRDQLLEEAELLDALEGDHEVYPLEILDDESVWVDRIKNVQVHVSVIDLVELMLDQLPDDAPVDETTVLISKYQSGEISEDDWATDIDDIEDEELPLKEVDISATEYLKDRFESGQMITDLCGLEAVILMSWLKHNNIAYELEKPLPDILTEVSGISDGDIASQFEVILRTYWELKSTRECMERLGTDEMQEVPHIDNMLLYDALMMAEDESFLNLC
ncbi:MAG: SMI1/KNR4 family protein [Lentisphaeria bacterium]|nr:SMI1/KNR4 family protein [Lentisphaeria bacterium]